VIKSKLNQTTHYLGAFLIPKEIIITDKNKNYKFLRFIHLRYCTCTRDITILYMTTLSTQHLRFTAVYKRLLKYQL